MKQAGIFFESVDGAMPWGSFIGKLANAKTSLVGWEAFWRGVGCNWVVCLAIYAAASAKETIGKIAALWTPTTAFVAGDPRYAALVAVGKASAAVFSWQDVVVGKLLPVTLGNIAGAPVGGGPSRRFGRAALPEPARMRDAFRGGPPVRRVCARSRTPPGC